MSKSQTFIPPRHRYDLFEKLWIEPEEPTRLARYIREPNQLDGERLQYIPSQGRDMAQDKEKRYLNPLKESA